MKVRQAAGTFVCAVALVALGREALLAQVPPIGGTQSLPPVQPVGPQPNYAPQPATPIQTNVPLTAPAPPFVLTPQQQAEVDRALAFWESKSKDVKSFKCNFNHFKYDPTFTPPNADPNGQPVPLTKSEGELYYSAPDKGMFREWNVITWQPNHATQRLEQVAIPNGEWWACDGKSVCEVNVDKKEVVETPLPPEMQGQSITEGPLPFAFGARADKLRARYYIRLITPPKLVQSEVWLEILPRWRQDAANFFKVEVILRATDMLPTGIRISTVQTKTGDYQDVYLFTDKGILDIRNPLSDIFHPSPLGYRHVLQPAGGANVSPPSSAVPAGNPQPPGAPQARRPYDPSQIGPR